MANFNQIDKIGVESGLVDILRPLNDEEFCELLEVYKEKYEANGFQYLLLLTQYQWNKQLKELNVNTEDNKWISFQKIFYTHSNGDFRKYGTYVCIHQDLVSFLQRILV